MTSPAGETPFWALSLAYWLHMLATITWIGGLAAIVLFLPPAQRSLDADAFATLLERIQRRLDPVGWMSLAVLVVTGLFQMNASPNYEGFFTFGNRWAAAILMKHLVFLGMIGISAYMTWGVLPGIRRYAILRARGVAGPEGERLQRREITLLRLNLVLGVIVLGLTALARAS
jgi:uncharacterized membrane protein